jgi:hypothetical protein
VYESERKIEEVRGHVEGEISQVEYGHRKRRGKRYGEISQVEYGNSKNKRSTVTPGRKKTEGTMKESGSRNIMIEKTKKEKKKDQNKKNLRDSVLSQHLPNFYFCYFLFD